VTVLNPKILDLLSCEKEKRPKPASSFIFYFFKERTEGVSEENDGEMEGWRDGGTRLM